MNNIKRNLGKLSYEKSIGEEERINAKKKIKKGLKEIKNYEKSLKDENRITLKRNLIKEKEYSFWKSMKKSEHAFSNKIELYIKEILTPEEFKAIGRKVLENPSINTRIMTYKKTTDSDIKAAIERVRQEHRQKVQKEEEQKTSASPSTVEQLPPGMIKLRVPEHEKIAWEFVTNSMKELGANEEEINWFISKLYNHDIIQEKVMNEIPLNFQDIEEAYNEIKDTNEYRDYLDSQQ